jgi:DNA polymerase I-like protein with 3'-5' exonuclease and polymerase domains
VSKNYALRSILYSDFKKAKQESETKEIKNIERELWIEPSINDLDKFKEDFIRRNNADHPLAFDIETAGGRITCIGFAPSSTHAIVVPFTYGYWKKDDETKAWNWVKDLLEDKQIAKVAQNQSYDVSWLKYKQDIEVKGIVHDTMHAQHSLQPEMEKGLGFLGSIYTNEGAWKTLAKFSQSTKADE